MSSLNRGVVYPLLTAVFVLLLGMAALLGVAYRRQQRLEDVTLDLRRNVAQQNELIKTLQRRLEDCNPVRNPDSSRHTKSDSGGVYTQVTARPR